jgi:hypothetical protein
MPATPVPDDLTTLTSVKNIIGIAATCTDEDNMIRAMIPMVSALITESLGRQFLLASNAANPITEVYSGTGTSFLNLKHWPVQQPIYTGNVTQNSLTITNLQSVNYLYVGQPVAGLGIPGGAIIASIATSPNNQVTLTGINGVNVTPSQTTVGAPILFGVSVFIDDNGYWRSASGAFPATNQQTMGSDYALADTGIDGSSRSGRLIRINQVWDQLWASGQWWLSPLPIPGMGNILVTYTGGFTSLPADIEWACIRCITKARGTRAYGDMIHDFKFEDTSFTLEGGERGGQLKGGLLSAFRLGLLDADVAPVLARYRRLRQTAA